MLRSSRIFFVALLVILFVQSLPAGASGVKKNGDLWINFTDNADDKSRRMPELRMSTSSTPGSQTTLINYRIFACRKIPVLYNQSEYSRLEVPDCGFTADPGNPTLPVRTIFLEFPPNHDYAVNLGEMKTCMIENISVLPSRPAPPETAEPAFPINRQIYQNNAYFPAGRILSVKIVKLRQRRLLEIRLTPVRFHPLRREVEFAYEIDLLVTFMAVGGE
ncbi:MAG: C25 family peptidase propeptide domain-containing protein [Pseudomonadota bacterium]|nr:C25 family peptidase propeptide domain-containing protein [Pseudomonadota bacterium]